MCMCVQNFIYFSEIQMQLCPMLAQMVKNAPAIQETRVQSPGQEDPLEKEMVTHSSILAWEMPWTEVPGGLQSMGSQRVRHSLATEQQIQKKLQEQHTQPSVPSAIFP